MLCPSQPEKEYYLSFTDENSTKELLSSGHLYYFVFPSKNANGFPLLQQPLLPILPAKHDETCTTSSLRDSLRLLPPSVRMGPARRLQMLVPLLFLTEL